MVAKLSYIKYIMVTVLTVTIFFSCKDNFQEVQNIGVKGSQPINIAENINTKYTDSGKLKTVLVSKKMLDFSNREFAFFEFPEGVDFTVYDDDGNANNVLADYAITYNDTNLIDLRGNVILSTHNKDTLYAEQLFYDQKKEWMFTNQPVKFRQQEQERIINGNGFDANRNFTYAKVLEINGVLYLDE
jgi:LPS export ABC transporter protein LptC